MIEKISRLFVLILLVAGSCQVPKQKESAVEVKQDLYEYDIEERIATLGITLNTPPAPVANYVNSVRSGNLVFMAGKGPTKPEGGYIQGKVGVDLTVEDGYAAARLAAIAQLSALKAEIGDLNKVIRIVKVTGMVNAAPEFTDQPEVVNGFSDLMVEVFGERGKHARAAVGMGSLPRNIAVEVEMVVEVED
jgi:enamine deaminase RidA (YjgF/YER057c/UK114 family)